MRKEETNYPKLVHMLCEIVGIKWTPKTPEGSDYLGPDECFMGPITMDQMVKLLTAANTFAQSTEALVSAQAAALESLKATQDKTVEVLQTAIAEHAKTEALVDRIQDVNSSVVTLLQSANDEKSAAAAITGALSLLDGTRNLSDTMLAEPLKSSDALAAQRWNALLQSAYLRPLGCAGISELRNDNYAHLGIELWTRFDAGHTDINGENERARTWLTSYADIAHKAQLEAKQGGAPLLIQE